MSKNRFKFLIANVRFDDEETRRDRWSSDRFAAFRELFEMFNAQCGKAISSEDYLSLDETLYPMRNQVSFKQFNPSKPAKYGLLFKSINAARYPYTFITAQYSGKPVGDAGEFYISGCDEIVKSLISRLEKSTDLKGRNDSFDRLYTSIPLCKWLLERQITSVGTLKTNRRGKTTTSSSQQFTSCTTSRTEVLTLWIKEWDSTPVSQSRLDGQWWHSFSFWTHAG